MSRFIQDYPSSSSGATLEKVEQFLAGEGFKKTGEEGGSVWRKGMGILAGPQCIKVEATDSAIHLEAWIKFALFPGVYIGELGIDGLFALIPKKMLKGRVEKIAAMIN